MNIGFKKIGKKTGVKMWIKNRIDAEFRKHKKLDWSKIAEKKILSQLKEMEKQKRYMRICRNPTGREPYGSTEVIEIEQKTRNIKMKLKTLKDLNLDIDKPFDDAIKSTLKQEAIKWVKEFDKRKIRMYKLDFKRFFNITEEDLK